MSPEEFLVVPVRLRPETVERVDELLARGPRTLTRSKLLRLLVDHALQDFPDERLHPPKPTPDERQATRDARIKEPAWAAELRELHAQGLTNQQLGERLGLSQVNLRSRLARLKLSANR